MPPMTVLPGRRETLNIRIKPEERSLIDRAAKVRGKNRTDFVLEAARAAAEDALLDRALISADPQAYTAFLARLDMPPQPNERLRKTMQTPAPWEKE
ncbi:type II toxin-antitoxin system TacA family antitoxin [Thauera sp. SDU_THAU2]|uniref:type II toxin-antitoxin system TacA family antitoxin n=1 Tax=Thauera sp. SDU_THAU2 TaxID=3136633 RepID=UPI00311EE4D4